MQNGRQLRVAVCAGTFHRQELLSALLAGIAQLEFRKVPVPQIEIVIVDNDEFASAEEVCRRAEVPWPLKYVVEPRRGITYVRNRALAEAGAVDFIAFIDDDEVPSPMWLDELLSAQARFSADVVSGPVLPHYSSDVPGWVKAGKFFEPPFIATGTQRGLCATNNVLIAGHVFNDVPAFDDSFALSGAEDTDFFLRVVERGFKIVWSGNAGVYETISRRRANVSWILRREYQTGNGWVFCEARNTKDVRSWTVRFTKACAHIAIGLGGALGWALLGNRPAAVQSLRRVALGAGMLAAFAGFRFMAYRRSSVPPLPDAKPA